MIGKKEHLNGTKEVREMVIDGTTGLIEIEKGLKVIPGANTIIASFDKLVNWARLSSLWPMTFGLA